MTRNRYCLYLKPRSVILQSFLLYGLLSLTSTALADNNLPEIGKESSGTDDIPAMTEQLKAIEGWVKQYTTYSLTDDSELQLKTDGFQIETNYQHGIVTEFEAKEGGEVNFKIKIPF